MLNCETLWSTFELKLAWVLNQLEIFRKRKPINHTNTSPHLMVLSSPLPHTQVSYCGRLIKYTKEISRIPTSIPGQLLWTLWRWDTERDGFEDWSHKDIFTVFTFSVHLFLMFICCTEQHLSGKWVHEGSWWIKTIRLKCGEKTPY